MPNIRPEIPIGRDTLPRVVHPRRLETESVHVGAPTRGHQHHVPSSHPVRTTHHVLAAVHLDRVDRREQDPHALLFEPTPGEFPYVRVCAGEKLHGQHRDIGAEPAIGLGQLDPDHARTQNDEVPRETLVFEDGFVGEVGHVRQSGDGRDGRAGAGANDEAPGGQRAVTGFERVGARETRGRQDDVDPLFPEHFRPLSFIYRTDRPHHVGADASHVDTGCRDIDAEPPGLPNSVGGFGGAQECLAGNATGPRTVTTQPVFLDERDAGTESRGEAGASQARRSSSDDYDVMRGGQSTRSAM